MDLTPQELETLNQELAPYIQQAYQAYGHGHISPVQVSQDLRRAGKLPAGYEVSRDGRVVKSDGILSWSGVLPVAAAAGGLIAPALFGAGGAAASGAGGVGIGETGATTGLGSAAAGSGVSEIVKKLAEAGIPIGAGLLGKGLSGGFGGQETAAPTVPPELTQLLQLSMKRMADQQPIADAVNRQTLAGLPNYAKG